MPKENPTQYGLVKLFGNYKISNTYGAKPSNRLTISRSRENEPTIYPLTFRALNTSDTYR